MRFAVAAVVGVALGYMEVGAVVWVGCIIMLCIAFLSKDVHTQTEQLTGVLKEQGELQADRMEEGLSGVHKDIEGLRRELLVVANALNAMNRKLDNVSAVVVPEGGPKGPWAAR